MKKRLDLEIASTQDDRLGFQKQSTNDSVDIEALQKELFFLREELKRRESNPWEQVWELEPHLEVERDDMRTNECVVTKGDAENAVYPPAVENKISAADLITPRMSLDVQRGAHGTFGAGTGILLFAFHF